VNYAPNTRYPRSRSATIPTWRPSLPLLETCRDRLVNFPRTSHSLSTRLHRHHTGIALCESISFMDRPTSEYAQPGSNHQHPPVDTPSEQKPADQTAAASAHYTPQPEVRPTPQYTPQPEVRPNISTSNTPQSDYGLNPPPTARSPAYQDYLHRPSYAPNSQPGGGAGMAQATSPFNLPTGPRSPNVKSDAPVPIDPSLPANSPTYPPPYSPYQPQGHEMAQYQGHPPPPQHMYARPDWPHSYGQQHHGLPGPYASPATTVGSTPVPATSESRPGQVCF